MGSTIINGDGYVTLASMAEGLSLDRSTLRKYMRKNGYPLETKKGYSTNLHLVNMLVMTHATAKAVCESRGAPFSVEELAWYEECPAMKGGAV